MMDRFMLNYECTCQELRLKDELDAALKRYNELFIPGSKKILQLISCDAFPAALAGQVFSQEQADAIIEMVRQRVR